MLQASVVIAVWLCVASMLNKTSKAAGNSFKNDLFALEPASHAGPSRSHTGKDGVNGSALFQAGVARATQESFNEAPDRYPWILQSISNATASAQATPIPNQDSGNLNECVVPKWQAFGAEATKTVKYIPGSLRTNITSTGLVSSADALVNFSVPVWLGGCAWRQFIPAYNKDPSKYPEVLKLLEAAIAKAAAAIHLPDCHGHIHSSSTARLGDDPISCPKDAPMAWRAQPRLGDCDTSPQYWIHGKEAQKSVEYVPNSLKLSIGSDNTSVVASADIAVEVDVPFEIRACKKILFFCTCRTVCPSGSTMKESFTVHVTIQAPCTQCPLPPATVPSVPTVTTEVTDTKVSFKGCNGEYFDSYRKQAEKEVADQTKEVVQEEIQQNKDKIPAVFCACITVCPHPGSSVSGSFVMTITSPIKASVTDGQLVVVGANSTVKYGQWRNFQVCASNQTNFYGYESEVRSLIINNTEKAITADVQNQTQQWEAPVTFQPFPPYPIWVTYQIEDIVYSPLEWIDVAATAVIVGVDNVTGVRFTYQDVYPPDAALLPPNSTWPSTDAKLFDGIRISSTALTGLLTVGDDLGYFAYSSTELVLDAGLRLNVTFAQPEVSVPENDFLSIYLPRGRITVTCMNNTKEPPLFDFAFSDVRVDGFVSYVSTPTAGFTVTVTGFDFSSTQLTLYAPNIPVPNEILLSLLKQATGNSIPTANEWFKLNPFVLPPSLARLVPRPLLHLVPQSGCCQPPNSGGWQHGYLDALSYSSSSNRLDSNSIDISQYRRSSGTNTQFLVLLYSNVSKRDCEIGSLGSYFVAVPAVDDGNCNVLWQKPDGSSLFHVYNSTTLTLTLSESPWCDPPYLATLDVTHLGTCNHVGDNGVGIGSTMVANADTGPQCTSYTDQTDTALLQIFSSGSQCRANTAEDSVTFVSISTKPSPSCYAFPAFLPVEGLYRVSSSTSDVFHGSFSCGSPGPPCSDCAFSITGLNNCTIIENASIALNLSLQVIPVDSISIFSKNSGQHRVVSNAIIIGIVLGVCAVGVLIALVYFAKVSIHCCTDYASRTFRDIAFGIQSLGHFVVGVCGKCSHFCGRSTALCCQTVLRWLRRRGHCISDICRNLKNLYEDYLDWRHPKRWDPHMPTTGEPWVNIDSEQTLSLVSLADTENQNIYVFLKRSRYAMPLQSRSLRNQTIGLLVVATCAMIVHAILWFTQRPFNIFSQSVFKTVGLSNTYLQAPQLHTNFQLWSNVGLIVAAVNTVLLAWMTARCVLIAKWHVLSPLYGKVVLCLHFGSLLLPPFLFRFADGFEVHDPQSKMISQDGQFRHTLESAIGTGFSTAAFNWYATVFVYALHTVQLAVFCASALFWFQRAPVAGPEWVFVEGRLKVLLWLVHLLCPFAGLLGVIVLYQTSGATADPLWASCWLLLWIIPACFLSLWDTVFSDPQAWRLQRFLAYLGLYVTTYISLLAYLIVGQLEVDKNIDGAFLVTTTVSTTVLLLTVLFVTFHHERLKDEVCFDTLKPLFEQPLTDINSAASPIDEPVDHNVVYSFSFASPFSSGTRGLWYFLWEEDEQRDPQRFGKRLPGRRLFLIASVGTLGAVFWQMAQHDLEHNAFDDFKTSLARLGYHIDWPQGGSMFDSLFRTYQDTRVASDFVLIFGWALLIVALVIEPVLQRVQNGRYHRTALAWSRRFVGASIVALFAGTLLPATPNYLKDSNIQRDCPLKCAPEFNAFVQSLMRNSIGLACSALFAFNLVVVLLAVPVALVRVSTRILIDRRFKLSFPARVGMAELHVYKRNVLMIFAWGSALAPLLCCLPTLLMYQFWGDTVMGICIALFASVPQLIAFFAAADRVTFVYVLYLIAYFGPLIAILVYETEKHSLTSTVVAALRDPMTFVELVSEVCLANVFVSDLCYSQFFKRAPRRP